jgi:sugar lactone lactonase YvrE
MIVKARILREMRDKENISLINSFSSYEECFKNEDIKENYIGFTTVMYNTNDKLLYCGISSFENDILYTFNPRTKEFRSLRYHEANGAEKYDVKVHRSLCLDDDGIIYGATAGLHGVPEYNQAPGGKIFRYDPLKDKLEILAIPLPHLYIQTITLDSKRKIIYGCTYPTAHLFRYDIKTNETRDLGLMGFPPHRPVVDAEGNLWACFHNDYPPSNPGLELLKYNPDEDRVYYGPWPKSCRMVRKQIDDMVLGPDGLVYIGTVTGELLRLDPKVSEMEYLGKPFHSTRMDVKFGKDGLLYLCSGYGRHPEGGVGGKDTGVFTYDVDTGKFDFLGYIFDKERKEGNVMVHDIAVTEDKIVYVAESDNLTRTCYLWECAIKD